MSVTVFSSVCETYVEAKWSTAATKVRVNVDKHPCLRAFLSKIKLSFPKVVEVATYSNDGDGVLDLLPETNAVTLTNLVVQGAPKLWSGTRSLTLNNVRFTNFAAFVKELGALDELYLDHTDVSDYKLLARLPLKRLRISGSDWSHDLAALLRAPLETLILYLPLYPPVVFAPAPAPRLDVAPSLVRLELDRDIEFDKADVHRLLREHKNLTELTINGSYVPETTYDRRRLAVFLFTGRDGRVGRFVSNSGDLAIAHRVAAFLFDFTVPLLSSNNIWSERADYADHIHTVVNAIRQAW